jgi:pyridoxine 4-dehydrogenase
VSKVKPAETAGKMSLGGEFDVARMGFGAMRLTGPKIWGKHDDLAECRRVLLRAVELGVNLIDTADVYGPYASEEIIASTLWPYPPGVIIGTKGGLIRLDADNFVREGTPKHLRAVCEGSLRRLRTDTIDLYQLHRPDPAVPVTESIGAMIELREEGKIRLIGVSNVTAAQLLAALSMTPIASVQNRYNVGDREAEDVLRICELKGIAFMPWSPLAVGTLTRTGSPLEAVATRHDAKPGQIALAWLLACSPVMVPIPGTSTTGHLEENVASAQIRLTGADLAELDGRAQEEPDAK